MKWLTWLNELGYAGSEAEKAAGAAHQAQVKGMSRAHAADVALALAHGETDVRIGLPNWERLVRDHAFHSLLIGLLLLPLSLPPTTRRSPCWRWAESAWA